MSSSSPDTTTGNNPPSHYHKGYENALLQYVKQQLPTYQKDDKEQKWRPGTDEKLNQMLSLIDRYCWSTQWMMHLGDEKSAILDRVLEKQRPKVILEMGCYCGYSGLRMMRYWDAKDDNCHFISLEYNSDNAKIATEMFQLAGREKQVDILIGPASDSLKLENDGTNRVQKLLAKKGATPKVDLVFIDHEKTLYLPDLLLLEKSGLLREDSVVVADNVVMFNIQDYLDHVRNSGLYKESVLHEAHAEYTTDRKDGVEVSVWKGKK